jgi:pimeloyl-ACP methyl ester carboxylesterase
MSQSIPLKILGVLVALWLLPATATAEEITLQLNSGLKVLADYRAAARDKPAVLVLHGFLQTHHFSTVHLIVDELVDAGYGVLSPTLSLNIDQRRTSLTCDAIQNHSVEQASAEIGAWVAWLKRQGYPRIILIGHSTGSNHLLSYLHAHPDPAVSAFIATSIGPIERWQHPDEERRQRAEAEAQLATGSTELRQYSLGFCRHNYTAPAREFLSYRHWDESHTLRQLKTSPVPITVVLGEEDKWVRPGWADRLEHEAIPLQRIKGANHYFSGIGEFDFQTSIVSLVSGLSTGGKNPR